MMSYGDLIDYLDAYLEMSNPDKPQKARKATQSDIDRFFG